CTRRGAHSGGVQGASSSKPAVIAVFTSPGEMENTNTFCGARDAASTSENRWTAALLAGYAVAFGPSPGGRYAEPDATLTMRPPPRSTISGANARQHMYVPSTFTSNVCHHSSTSASGP